MGRQRIILMNRHNIKPTDYILSIFSTHSVYLDANILLDEKTCKAWKNAILPRLARCNRKFIVIASVMAEIRKKADTVMAGDAALACRARKALDDLNNLVQQNLCEIKEVEIDSEFADSAFYSLFAAKRLQENILLITRDKGLARDVLRLNKSESVRSYRPILVWFMEDSGFINTHYHWGGYEGSACSKSKELLYCATCGKPFYLPKVHKQFYLSRGLTIPTHCPNCRGSIRKFTEKKCEPDYTDAILKFVETFREQLASNINGMNSNTNTSSSSLSKASTCHSSDSFGSRVCKGIGGIFGSF